MHRDDRAHLPFPHSILRLKPRNWEDKWFLKFYTVSSCLWFPGYLSSAFERVREPLSSVPVPPGPDWGPPFLHQVTLPTPWGSHPPLRDAFQVLWWCQWFLAPCLQPTLSSTTKKLQFFCPIAFQVVGPQQATKGSVLLLVPSQNRLKTALGQQLELVGVDEELLRASHILLLLHVEESEAQRGKETHSRWYRFGGGGQTGT